MKKLFTLLLLLIIACGSSSEEVIVEDINTNLNVSEDTTSTSLQQITTTTKLTTTTTTTTTTTLPPTTGVGLDENGNDIFPAIDSIEILSETFEITRYSAKELSDGIIDPLRGNEILLRVGLLPGTNPIYQLSISFTTMSDENNIPVFIGACSHSAYNDSFNNSIKEEIYQPINVEIYCGVNNRDTKYFSFNNNPNNFPGRVFVTSISVYDIYENYTTYSNMGPDRNYINTAENRFTLLTETQGDKVSDELFPTREVFIINR